MSYVITQQRRGMGEMNCQAMLNLDMDETTIEGRRNYYSWQRCVAAYGSDTAPATPAVDPAIYGPIEGKWLTLDQFTDWQIRTTAKQAKDSAAAIDAAKKDLAAKQAVAAAAATAAALDLVKKNSATETYPNPLQPAPSQLRDLLNQIPETVFGVPVWMVAAAGGAWFLTRGSR